MEDPAALWLPGSFGRRPEWRWLRASYVAGQRVRADPGIDDEWVGHALAAVRGRGSGRAKVEAVRAAQAVWSGGPPDRRWELEARLLTDAPLDHVARRSGLPVGVVEAYAEVFFAVRPMRPAVDWVLTRAIGYRPPGEFTSPQPGGVWKYAGFFGGPIVLDAVIAATTGRPLPDGLVRGAGPRRRFGEARLRLLARLWVAAVCAKSDEEVARVIAARERLRDLEAGAAGLAGSDRASLKAIEAFGVALPAIKRRARRGNTKAPAARCFRPAGRGQPGAFDEDGRTAGQGRPARTREG